MEGLKTLINFFFFFFFFFFSLVVPLMFSPVFVYGFIPAHNKC